MLPKPTPTLTTSSELGEIEKKLKSLKNLAKENNERWEELEKVLTEWFENKEINLSYFKANKNNRLLSQIFQLLESQKNLIKIQAKNKKLVTKLEESSKKKDSLLEDLLKKEKENSVVKKNLHTRNHDLTKENNKLSDFCLQINKFCGEDFFLFSPIINEEGSRRKKDIELDYRVVESYQKKREKYENLEVFAEHLGVLTIAINSPEEKEKLDEIVIALTIIKELCTRFELDLSPQGTESKSEVLDRIINEKIEKVITDEKMLENFLALKESREENKNQIDYFWGLETERNTLQEENRDLRRKLAIRGKLKVETTVSLADEIVEVCLGCGKDRISNSLINPVTPYCEDCFPLYNNSPSNSSSKKSSIPSSPIAEPRSRRPSLLQEISSELGKKLKSPFSGSLNSLKDKKISAKQSLESLDLKPIEEGKRQSNRRLIFSNFLKERRGRVESIIKTVDSTVACTPEIATDGSHSTFDLMLENLENLEELKNKFDHQTITAHVSDAQRKLEKVERKKVLELEEIAEELKNKLNSVHNKNLNLYEKNKYLIELLKKNNGIDMSDMSDMSDMPDTDNYFKILYRNNRKKNQLLEIKNFQLKAINQILRDKFELLKELKESDIGTHRTKEERILKDWREEHVKQKEKLEKKLIDEEDRIIELEEKIKFQIREFWAQKNNLLIENHNYLGTINELITDKFELENEIDDLNAEKDILENVAKELQEDLDQERLTNQKIQIYSQELRDYKELLAQNKEIIKENQLLSDKLATAKVELANIQDKSQEATINSLTEQISTLNTELSKKETILNTLRWGNVKFISQITSERNKIKELVSDKVQLEKDKERLTNKLQETKKSLAEKEEKQKLLETEAEKSLKKIKNLTKQAKDKEKAKQQINLLKSEIATERLALNRNQEIVKDLNTNLNSKDKEIKELLAKITEYEENLAQTNEDLEITKKSLVTEEEKLGKKLAKNKNELDSKVEFIKKIKATNESLQNSKEELERDIELKNRNFVNLQKELEASQEEILEVKDSLTSQINHLKTAYQNDLGKAKSINEVNFAWNRELEEKLEKITTEKEYLESASLSLQREVKFLVEKKNALETNLTVKEAEALALTTEKESLAINLTKAQKDLAKATEEIKHSKATIKTINKELANSQDKSQAEIKKLHANLANTKEALKYQETSQQILAESLRTAKSDWTNLKDELTKSRQDFQAEQAKVNTLTNDLATEQAEKATLTEENTKLQTKWNALETNLTVKEAEALALTTEKESLAINLTKAQKDLTAETSKLTALQTAKDTVDANLLTEQAKVNTLNGQLITEINAHKATQANLVAETARANNLDTNLTAEVNAHKATQTALTSTQQQLTTTERSLGINSVSDIPTIMNVVPAGTTLQQLVNAYNSLPAQVNQAQQAQIQAERDRDNKEKVITTKLITELDLSIEKDSNLEEVIAKLKILLDKAPMEEIKAQLNEAQQIIKGLKEQLALVNKEEAVNDEKQAIISEELVQVKNKQQIERGFFITSLGVSLITIGDLVRKMKSLTKK